ncbi:ATP synthase subunit I [uncultured Desulfosarcina sp.]|uniref:ATP synthase subunit I n=1 Tax=uncultured Desulfosarcina sp. TaxID=218289 RepID=UPI0029C93165|nr:ATP synthase subunit I [uncultured Desulfosarcina sp.]
METDTTVFDIQKKYGSRALVLAIGAGLLFLALGQQGICRGLVLGGVFSAVNFAIMGQLIRFRIRDNRKAATRQSLLSLLLRYALLAIPLVLAVRSDRFNFPATAVGLFMVQLVIMVEHGSRLIFTAVKH